MSPSNIKREINKVYKSVGLGKPNKLIFATDFDDCYRQIEGFGAYDREWVKHHVSSRSKVTSKYPFLGPRLNICAVNKNTPFIYWESFLSEPHFFGFCPNGNTAVICPNPTIKTTHFNNREVLHSNDGPAFYWENGAKFFFLNGISIPESWMVKKIHEIDPKEILAERNVDVRRELIRRIGIEQFINYLPHNLLDKVGNYELYNVQLSETVRNARYLKMSNPSIEAFHIEGVEGNTVQEALNWRASRLIRNMDWKPSILT